MKRLKLNLILLFILTILTCKYSTGQSLTILKKDSSVNISRSDLVLLLNESKERDYYYNLVVKSDKYIKGLENSIQTKSELIRIADLRINDLDSIFKTCTSQNVLKEAKMNKENKRLKTYGKIKSGIIVILLGVSAGLYLTN